MVGFRNEALRVSHREDRGTDGIKPSSEKLADQQTPFFMVWQQLELTNFGQRDRDALELVNGN